MLSTTQPFKKRIFYESKIAKFSDLETLMLSTTQPFKTRIFYDRAAIKKAFLPEIREKSSALRRRKLSKKIRHCAAIKK